MRTARSLGPLLSAAALASFAGGCHLSGSPQSKEMPVTNVPIWQTGPLPPLDYKKLSKGKVTRYFPSTATPNNPADEAMLEACRELPIHNATARSAFVVIKCSQGTLPLSALVVGNIVLMPEGDCIRAMQVEYKGSGNGEMLYPLDAPSITLMPKSEWAVVGDKKIELQFPVYAPAKGGLVMTRRDLLTVFHERDVQLGGPPTIQSAEVSYEPDAYKLYSH